VPTQHLQPSLCREKKKKRAAAALARPSLFGLKKRKGRENVALGKRQLPKEIHSETSLRLGGRGGPHRPSRRGNEKKEGKRSSIIFSSRLGEKGKGKADFHLFCRRRKEGGRASRRSILAGEKKRGGGKIDTTLPDYRQKEENKKRGPFSHDAVGRRGESRDFFQP